MALQCDRPGSDIKRSRVGPSGPETLSTSLRCVTRSAEECAEAMPDFFSIHEDDDEEDEDVLEFFEGLLGKDENLRGYYEKNWEKGEFCCLVCGAIGEKLGKRFGDCVGLVQHANTVSKMKRFGGHRAFGRAVCEVLGWDVNKLPGILMGGAREVIDEVGLHNEVGDLVGPDKGDKGDSMDSMETDDDADTD